MDSIHAKQMMDSFYAAKRIRDLMPPLPEGIRSSYVNIIDSIVILSEHGIVKISDIAAHRNLPRPVITRDLKEMENAGLIRKVTDKSDRRIVHILLSEKGKEIYRTYVQDYFSELSRILKDIPDSDIERMSEVITKIQEILKERG